MARQQAAAEAQAAQTGLATLVVQQVAALWPSLRVDDLAGSLPQFTAAIAALIQRYGLASATVAVDFYEAERAAAKARGSFTAEPADPLDLGHVAASVGWATRSLWSRTPNVDQAKEDTAQAAARLALHSGRETIVDALLRDRQAVGWARVTRPGCCYFCAMLATRGAVYKSRESALLTSGTRGRRAAGLRYHDHCRCIPEPVFRGEDWEPHERVKDWQQLYAESTTGKSGNAAVRAFRHAYENHVTVS